MTSRFAWAHLLDNCAVVEVAATGAGWTCIRWAGLQPLAAGQDSPAAGPAA